MKIVGIILIVLGILAFIYHYDGFSYETTKKDLQLGPLEVQHQETHTIPVSPIVGGVLVAAGAIALLAGGRGKL